MLLQFYQLFHEENQKTLSRKMSKCSRILVLPSCSSFKNNNICWQISIINPKHSLFKTLLQPYLQFTSLYLLIISLPISVKRPTNPNTLTQKPFSHLKKRKLFCTRKATHLHYTLNTKALKRSLKIFNIYCDDVWSRSCNWSFLACLRASERWSMREVYFHLHYM